MAQTLKDQLAATPAAQPEEGDLFDRKVLRSFTDSEGRITAFPAQEKKFLNDPMWGVPMSELQNYLNLETTQMPVAIKEFGIPTDSVPGKTGEAAMSEFQIWVKAAHEANPDAKIAIKADEKTPYKTVKKIMSELQDMSENRYYLITQYKKTED